MSGMNHITDQVQLRSLYINKNDFEKVLGSESCKVQLLDRYQYKIGERVKVSSKIVNGKLRSELWVLRYIVAIRPVMVLYKDDSIVEFTLSVFNEASF